MYVCTEVPSGLPTAELIGDLRWKCSSPYFSSALRLPFPCYKCDSCCVSRRREWAHRCLLEALEYPLQNVSMLTVTYAEGYCPLDADGQMILLPSEHVNFIKRLRKEFQEELKFRFFMAGEYGRKNSRPHFHYLLFGLPGCRRLGGTRRDPRGAPDAVNCCDVCYRIHKAWNRGMIEYEVARDPAKSAGYIAKYLVKGIRKADDSRLSGRPPEFSRMSRRPGLGSASLDRVAETVVQWGVDRFDYDAPGVLRRGAGLRPLGRFLRGKLRMMLSGDERSPPDVVDRYREMLSPLLAEAMLFARKFPHAVRGRYFKEFVEKRLGEIGAHYYLRLDSRVRVRSGKDWNNR